MPSIVVDLGEKCWWEFKLVLGFWEKFGETVKFKCASVGEAILYIGTFMCTQNITTSIKLETNIAYSHYGILYA